MVRHGTINTNGYLEGAGRRIDGGYCTPQVELRRVCNRLGRRVSGKGWDGRQRQDGNDKEDSKTAFHGS
jgi:hypothetical protein